jgi:hypothetical protein
MSDILIETKKVKNENEAIKKINNAIDSYAAYNALTK